MPPQGNNWRSRLKEFVRMTLDARALAGYCRATCQQIGIQSAPSHYIKTSPSAGTQLPSAISASSSPAFQPQ